jgi:ribosome modulation factor
MDMSGHNSNELTPAERKALMMHHMRAISAQQAICDRENEERKRLRKVAKTDGISLADVDYGLRILKIETPEIILDELRRHRELAEWFGLPILTQAEFDFEREPAVDRAFREGAVAGSLGRDMNPPYGSPSALYDSWKDGWRQAQDQMLADFASANEKLQRMQSDEGEAAPLDEEGGEEELASAKTEGNA